MLPWLFALACADGTPTVTITAPVEDAVVCGSPLVIVLDITDFVLEAPGGDVRPGAGHCDLSLNGQDVAMTAETTVDVADVADGLYQITAELVNADHTAIDPNAGDTVYATVSDAACP